MSKHGKNKNQTCPEEGCERPIKRRGFCLTCYKRKLRNGDLQKLEKKTCSVDNCDLHHHSRGFCKKHYERFKTKGTIEAKKITDLPGEEWREVEGHVEFFVSNKGRVKSCKTRNERLIKQRYGALSKGGKPHLTATADGTEILVGLEVLKAFIPNEHSDYLSYYKDGNNQNCDLSNLAWYGQGIMLPKAIEMAEGSDSKWADCFLLFWHGETEALNNFWAEMKSRIDKFVYYRAYKFNVHFAFDVEDISQETLVKAFMSIKRGMINSLDHITSFCFRIAKTVLAQKFKTWIPVTALTEKNAEGSEHDRADLAGWTHPSAEDVYACFESFPECEFVA